LRGLGIDDMMLVLRQTGCDGVGMCCERGTLVGWRAPQREMDRGGVERLRGRIAEQGGCCGLWWMEEAGRDWMMIRTVGG